MLPVARYGVMSGVAFEARHAVRVWRLDTAPRLAAMRAQARVAARGAGCSARPRHSFEAPSFTCPEAVICTGREHASNVPEPQELSHA